MGTWRQGNMHGFGRYVWSDEKRYEGQYVDDKKHGYGIYQWPDGRLYKGYWKDGNQHGLAEYQTLVTTQDEDGGAPRQELQCRYGLWREGKRLKWFSLDKALNKRDQLR